MSTSNTIFSILSCIGFFLVCLPLPSHLKSWNTGTCLYSIWIALSLFAFCINSIIWRDNVIDRAPVWCDICVRLFFSNPVATSAASLCINHRLYKIITLQTISWSQQQKHRMIALDLAIGVGAPIISMILEYVVEENRYAIIGELGCYPDIGNTPVGIVLRNGPPVVLSFLSAYYAIRSVRAYMRAGKDIKKHISATSGINLSVWYRLLALASIEVLIILPLLIYVVISNTVINKVDRWTSWKEMHAGTSQINVIPSLEDLGLPATVGYNLRRWPNILYAFNFFALFGLTGEARGHYKNAWDSLMKSIGRTTGQRSFNSRLKALTERLSFRKTRTGTDSDITASSRQTDDKCTTLNSVFDLGPIHEEPPLTHPDIARLD